MPQLLTRLRRSVALVAIATLAAVGLTVGETVESAHAWSSQVTVDSPTNWGMSVEDGKAMYPDGSKMFVSTQQGTVVYNLNTATVWTSFPNIYGLKAYQWNAAGTRLYATDGSRVVAFDTSTATPTVLYNLALINSGYTTKWGMRITPDGSALYVANAAGLVKIPTSTFVPELVLASSNAWQSIAINPSGTTAYIGGSLTNNLYPVTLSTGTLGTAISTSIKLTANVLSPDGTKAYFWQAFGANAGFQVLNLSTGALGALVVTGSYYIFDMSVSGDSASVAAIGTDTPGANGSSGKIFVYNTSTMAEKSSVSVGAGARAVVLNNDGTRAFYINNTGLTSAGTYNEFIVPLKGSMNSNNSGGNNTIDVAMSPDGLQLYAINAGQGVTFTSSVTIAGAAYASPQYQAQEIALGSAITPTAPLTANGLTGTITWAGSSVPAGLTVDSTTGVVTGTPTTARAGGYFNITGTASPSGLQVVAFVELRVTSLTPASQTVNAFAGSAITATANLTSTTGGLSGTPTYTISPALPIGLAIASGTGVISGTPRLPQASATYTITATGATAGTATSTVTIQSGSVTPQSVQYLIGTVGTPITPSSPFVSQFTTGTPTWTSGALPAGLSLDAATGVVSGTPTTAAGWTTVNLTGTYGAVTTIRQVAIGIGTAGQTLSNPGPITATIGTAITSVTSTASGFTAAPTIGLLNLPGGISATGGVITGTPTQPTSTAVSSALSQTVNIKATYSTTEFAFVAVPYRLSSAGKSISMPATITTPVNQAMAPSAAPTNVGLTGPIGYWINPSLPAGLTMNALTGVISGTPTSQSPTTTYTVTAIGSAATLDMATTTFSLAVTGTLSPATQTVNASPGVAITDTSTFTTTGITGTPTYTVSPALPNGLQLSASTGVVSGTPTTSQAATNYTITATGATSGSATSTLTIGVAGITPLAQTIRAVKGTAMTSSTAFTATSFVGAVSYALTGTLPTGLSFSTATGVISGTPSTSQAATSYTVTATGATSGTATATISLSVAELPPATTSVQGTVGTAITSTTPFAPVSLTAPITYSISPSLPSALSLNTSTGVISGTPNLAQASTSYTVTATDANSTAVSTTLTIQIAGLNPASQSVSTQVGSAITSTAALTATGFSGAVSYAISPSLPTGMAFSTSTGVISGTPSSALAQQVYTITGTGATAGTATTTVTITAAAITPATQTLTLTAGTAAPSTALSHFGFTGTMSYAISPAAPAGMTFSTTTGVLSGAPTTAQGATTYTVTATGSTAGSATATISLQVLLNVTPATQRVLGQVGQALATQSLTAGGVSTSAAYTVSPALPAGLSISSSTGVISGTPTAGSAATDYTVTATGSVVAGQTGTAVVTIGVNTSSVTLTPARQSVVGAVGTILNSALLTPSGFGGAVTYTVSPALPTGLAISQGTGVIAGTPTVAQPSTSYVISATGATSGAASAVVEIAVNSASVSLTPSSLSVQATQNLAIAATHSLSASGLVGAVSYTVSPALPAGLTLNASTGVISGTPTVAQAAAPYVVTGAGATSGIASATVTIGVASASASVSRPSQVIQAEAGQPITQSASIDASGLVGTVTYSITPQLPGGLFFNPSTGIISGTPVSPLNGVTFTITASGSTSGVASGIVTLTVASAGAEVTNTPATVLAQAGQAITATAALNVSGMTAPVVYSVSPQLPAGLTIDPSTGIISGTPAAGSPATEYLITASGAGGEIASAPVVIATASAGASASPAAQQQTGTAGVAMTATAAITPTGLTGTPTYTVTPALPDGLSIDPVTGVISGTPTGGFVATSFVITGTGSGGGVLTSSVTLASSSAGASSTPAASVTTGTVGSGITPTTAPSVTGIGSPVAFQVYPALPAGLTLNPSTGVISGTPSSALAATTYYVSAVGPNGVSVIPATISFSSVGTTMTPSSQTVTAQQGVAITQTSAFTTSGLGLSVSYTVSPALPAGLTMDSSTGRITGTPTSAQAGSQYVISAAGSTGSAAANITITVTGLTPGSQTMQGTVGSAISPSATLSGVGFAGAITYSVSPALPQGLALDQATGVVSGAPMNAQAAANYTITGTDSSSNAGTAVVSIQIAGLSPASQAVQGTAGAAITATTAFTATGFAGAMSYTVSPALPSGLNISQSTGVISGTPAAAQAASSYTVTATGATAGTATAIVSIRVAGLTPVSQSLQGTAGTALSPSASLTPTGFAGAVSFTVSPALPNGVTLNGSTGVVSGTPAAGQTSASYTITATGASAGTASATLALQVAALSPASQTINATYGVAITPTTALTPTGFTGAVSYVVAPGLPSGLQLNATTGVISGTPTESHASSAFVITASGATAGVSSTALTLSVAAVAPGAPSNVNVTMVRGQAVVAWTPGNTGGAAVTFTVTASPGGATCVTTGSSCVIPNLTSGVNYTFSVDAANGSGSSTPAPSSPVIAPPVTVPSAPPAASVGTALSVTNASGQSVTSLLPGVTYTVAGSGFAPNSDVTIVFYSTPTTVGTATVNGQGAFSTSVTVPVSLASGNHTLVALGVASSGATEANATVAVSVAEPGSSAAGLANTGATADWLAALAVLLAAFGAILATRARRRV